jgi:hypothetical protein
MVQSLRSQVRFPMRSLDSIDLIPPFRMTTSPPSVGRLSRENVGDFPFFFLTPLFCMGANLCRAEGRTDTGEK